MLTLTDAVHRISGHPAARLGLCDRGLLKVGAFADVVVFDAAQVHERASLSAPTEHPSGFQHVLVNGQLVVLDGQRNSARPGRVLRGGG